VYWRIGRQLAPDRSETAYPMDCAIVSVVKARARR
jgi:hypothetical protein